VPPLPEEPPESGSESSESEEGEGERERRVETFRAMLRDKRVAPFSSWDKELPKFVFDPRFKVRVLVSR